MANRSSGHQPGGGLHSKNVVQQPVRTGSGSRNARPAGTAQIGIMYGDKATHGEPSGYHGEKLHGPAARNFQPTKFGNELAARTERKPGGSREVMSSGSQGCHGQPAQGQSGLPSTKGQWPD